MSCFLMPSLYSNGPTYHSSAMIAQDGEKFMAYIVNKPHLGTYTPSDSGRFTAIHGVVESGPLLLFMLISSQDIDSPPQVLLFNI